MSLYTVFNKIINDINNLTPEEREKEYRNMVQKAYSGNKHINCVWAGTIPHKKYVLKHIIDKTGNNLKIFTEEFDKLFLEDKEILNHLESAVNRGVNIDVIVEKYGEQDKDFMKFIKKHPRNVSLYQLKEETKINQPSSMPFSVGLSEETIKNFKVFGNKYLYIVNREYHTFIKEPHEIGGFPIEEKDIDSVAHFNYKHGKMINDIFEKELLPKSEKIILT